MLPEVSAALLAAIDTATRSAVRDNRLATVIVVGNDLVLHLHEYLAATWLRHRLTKVFTVARVAAGEEQAAQTADEPPPPDPLEGAPAEPTVSRASGPEAHAAAADQPGNAEETP